MNSTKLFADGFMDELKAENNSYTIDNVGNYFHDQLYEIPQRKSDTRLPSEVILGTQTL